MEYQRSWLRDLAISVFALTSVSALCGFLAYSARSIDVTPLRTFAISIIAILFAGNAAIWLWWVFWMLVRRQSFVCRVTSRLIECFCPIPLRGSSFTLPLHELDSVRMDALHEGGQRCTLITTDGREYDLTFYYGNPVHLVIDAIAHLKPDVAIVGYTPSTFEGGAKWAGNDGVAPK
ncbi:hypothetical protein [Rhodopirellula sp. P2]|uniref:hypothetical protein n=1 Tax=Rhodopirellula sp. P2 TaxID=2127060 RepID=UPI0023687C1B|nr:hypothetical protein [Rhodopirellula sp. P2]WDQ16076.1 hypothetical protein PSR62_20945 [Rhodopirellula sp. P2]